MNFAAVTPVYNEEKLITGCIKSLEPFVEEHVVLVSERPYYGNTERPDDTFDIAYELGAVTLKGEWDLDHHQRNCGIKMLENYDWIICTDVDMWMTQADMKKLIKTLETTKEDAFVMRQIAYWKDTDHILVDDDFTPVIAVRPHVRFTHIGNIDAPAPIIEGCVCHHINWCEPKDIRKKVLTYPHAPEFNGELWYKTHYRNWTDKDRYAILPNRTFEVKRQPLPDELKNYLP